MIHFLISSVYERMSYNLRSIKPLLSIISIKKNGKHSEGVYQGQGKIGD